MGIAYSDQFCHKMLQKLNRKSLFLTLKALL